MWHVYAGAFLSILGLFGFTPFKFEGWSVFAIGLYILLVLGYFYFAGYAKNRMAIVIRGKRLVLSEIQLVFFLKKRRSAEFSLATQKINSAKLEDSVLRITYERAGN